MLIPAVEAYLAVRRACGFALEKQGGLLQSFAAFSDSRDQHHVCAATAIEWAGLARSVHRRARRLGTVIRFARYMRAEDPCHELPPAVFGSEGRPRPTPYILSTQEVQRLIQAASQRGQPSLRRETYSTLFALLACTGLRVSEAIRLRYEHITSQGLVIRDSKFRKSRLVGLHESAHSALERYLQKRRHFAPFDDHVFVSLRKKPLRNQDIDAEFHAIVTEIGLPCGPGKPRLSPHSLRHHFAVRALETCPDGRDRITQHMLALSAYLGHSSVAHTYWYLEATPDLMRDIADCSERFVKGAQS